MLPTELFQRALNLQENKQLVLNIIRVVVGESHSKSAMCRHENEGDERRRRKKTPIKEMENPSFL